MSTTAADNFSTLPTEVGRAQIEYPFKKNGDRTTRVVKRTYKQLAGNFTPTALGSPDATFPDHYLTEETDPQPTQTGLEAFTRTYAMLPGNQVEYSSRIINKPSASSVGGTTTTSTLFYENHGGASLGQYTTYQNYIFGPNTKVYGPIKTSTSANSGANTRITSVAHGITGTETLVVSGVGGFTNRYAIVAPAGYSVVSADLFDVLNYNLNATGTGFAKYLRDYTEGTDRVITRLTRRFYLPGVTAGIASPTDIPAPDTLLNDTAFMAKALTTTTGFADYDATELAQWLDGPIYTQQFIEINMANI